MLDIKDFEPAGLASLGRGQHWVCLGKHLCGAATDFALLCMARCTASPAGASSEAPQPQQHSEASSDARDQHSTHTHLACAEEQEGVCEAEPRGSLVCPPENVILQNGLCQQKDNCEQKRAVALGKAKATKLGLQGFGIATCCHHRCSWEHYVGRSFFQEHNMAEADFQLVSWMTGAHPDVALNAFPLPEQYLQGEGCLLALSQEQILRLADSASVNVHAQAGQCAVTAARPEQRLLVATSRKAVATAMQPAVPKAVHAWRNWVLQTAAWCNSLSIHM